MGYIATGRTVNGARQRRSVRGTTESEARQKLREVEAELILGKPVADGTIRLAPFLQEWLSTTIVRNPVISHTRSGVLAQ